MKTVDHGHASTVVRTKYSTTYTVQYTARIIYTGLVNLRLNFDLQYCIILNTWG